MKSGSSGELDQKLLNSQELLESSQQLPESTAANKMPPTARPSHATPSRLPRGRCPDLSESAPLPPGKNTGVGCHFLLQELFPDPGIKPTSPVSPTLAGDSLPLSHLGSPYSIISPLRFLYLSVINSLITRL